MAHRFVPADTPSLAQGGAPLVDVSFGASHRRPALPPSRIQALARRRATVVGLVALVALVALVSAASGCLTLNPASHPRASSARLRVEGGRFFQGRNQIDEQDFYELAGDKDAVKKIQAHRRGLIGTQLGGQAAGAGGIGGIVAGGGVLAGGIVWTVQSGPIGLLLLLPGALLLTGGIVAVPVGYVEAADAADEMYAPVLPLSRAEAVAQRANKRRD